MTHNQEYYRNIMDNADEYDVFFISDGELVRLYYNPDSNEGSFVVDHFDYETIYDGFIESEEPHYSPSDLFDVLNDDCSRREYYYDTNDEHAPLDELMDTYLNPPADAIVVHFFDGDLEMCTAVQKIVDATNRYMKGEPVNGR